MRTDWTQIKDQIIQNIDITQYCESRLEKVKEVRGEISACCPFHDDDEPSFSINSSTGLFHCFGCSEEGTLFDLHMHIHGMADFKEALTDLAELANVELPVAKKLPQKRPPIDEGLVKKWAESLAENHGIAKRLIERGISEKTMGRHQIGWDGVRYTIPIRDGAGRLVNIRRYDPGNATRKMINYATKMHSYGSPARLYGADRLRRYKGPIIVCEGEWDRLMLEQNGFPAVTGTHGAGCWRSEWSKLFKKRKVAIIMDTDQPGKKAADVIAESVYLEAESVRIVELPFPDKSGKDITDFFLAGRTLEELVKLIKNTPIYTGKAKRGVPYNWEVKSIEIMKTSPPIYTVEFPQGKIEMTTDDIMIPRRFKRQYFEEFQKFITLPEKDDEPTWEEYIEGLMESATIVSITTDSTPSGALREFIVEYLKNISLTETPEALNSGRGIILPDGRIYFKMNPLRRTVQEEFKGEFKLREITAQLKTTGCTGSIVAKIGGQSHRVWVTPLAGFEGLIQPEISLPEQPKNDV
jgi:hypothetical protein